MTTHVLDVAYPSLDPNAYPSLDPDPDPPNADIHPSLPAIDALLTIGFAMFT
jgi:hypothetical protein